MNQPYAVQQGLGNHQYDAMADDIQRMALGTAEFNRQNADRLKQLQGNAHAGQRDNIKAALNHPSPPTPPNQRLRPEDLPAAGATGTLGGGVTVRAALHGGAAGAQTAAQLQSSAVWTARYEAPQYGRRRCPELQITGPSLRAGGGRPGSAHAGGYTPAADDATTYVSSSYATYFK